MYLLTKKENELTKKEELKLEIMKALAFGKGYNADNPDIELDFRDGSNFENTANLLVLRFEISLKKEITPEIEKVKKTPTTQKAK